MLIQTLWKQKIDWDEPLGQDVMDRWISIASDIQEATTISLIGGCTSFQSPRLLPSHNFMFLQTPALVHMAVAYLRQDDQVLLVMSRSRVTPVKPITTQD